MQDGAIDVDCEDQLSCQEPAIKVYLSQNKSWCECIEEGQILFAPLCFPYADHWITVVMWLHEDNYYIRVYNSYPQYRKYDKHVACMFSFLYHKMQPKTKVKWLMRLPHDRLEQRPSDNRCGVFVIARAWQVLCGQFLTHKFTCRENVWAIGSYLSCKFLTYDASLCGDDVATAR